MSYSIKTMCSVAAEMLVHYQKAHRALERNDVLLAEAHFEAACAMLRHLMQVTQVESWFALL